MSTEGIQGLTLLSRGVSTLTHFFNLKLQLYLSKYMT